MRGIISVILAGASSAGVAEAAPWVREDGGWYARALGAHDTLNGADGWRLDFYGEYGVTDKITVTVKNEAVTYPDFRAFYGSTLSGSNGRSLVFCEGTGIEARIGGGWSGHYRDRPLYAFVDAAHLAQDGGCNRNRIEAGYGQDLSRHIFIGQQIWFEEGEISGRSVKTETQLGVHFGPADVSLGYREEIGGAFNENAVLIAVVMRR